MKNQKNCKNCFFSANWGDWNLVCKCEQSEMCDCSVCVDQSCEQFLESSQGIKMQIEEMKRKGMF